MQRAMAAWCGREAQGLMWRLLLTLLLLLALLYEQLLQELLLLLWGELLLDRAPPVVRLHRRACLAAEGGGLTWLRQPGGLVT